MAGQNCFESYKRALDIGPWQIILANLTLASHSKNWRSVEVQGRRDCRPQHDRIIIRYAGCLVVRDAWK